LTFRLRNRVLDDLRSHHRIRQTCERAILEHVAALFAVVVQSGRVRRLARRFLALQCAGRSHRMRHKQMFTLPLFALAIWGAVPFGPEVGKTVPEFSAPDQTGKPRTLKSIMGPKGALLVFYRSADW
jgi:hypothetical protein